MLCKNCKYWKHGTCERAEEWYPYEDKTRGFDVCSETDEGANFSVWLETGPNFGCVLFEQKEK